MVDREGNIYTVANAGKHAIKKFDAAGKFVAGYGTFGKRDGQFASPTGMAVDASGNIYVNDFQAARVLKFDPDWNFVTAWVTEPPVGPAGIGIDKNGNVYVANHRTHDHYVQKFDSNGQLLTEWGSSGTGDGQLSAESHSGPEMLAVGADGSIFVTDPDNNRIQKFDSDGQFLAMIGTHGTQGQGQFEKPFSVALDGEGNLYVADFHFIQKFDSDGQFLTQWSNTEGDLTQAGFMTVDAQGNIYVIAAADVVATLTGKTLHTSVLKKFRQC
jgi:DNA-binding beta-propeller fold protein YncE